MESSVLIKIYSFSFCLVFKVYRYSLQILQFISGHLIFLGSVNIGSYLIVALFERKILTLARFSDVFPDLQIMHVRAVYHTIFWTWTMFHLRVFSIDIHKKCNSSHYLLLLVIFHDLRMTQFWSGKYVCLVYKLKFLLWTCPIFWAIFMTNLWPLYLELLYLEPQFLVLFGDCRNLFFDEKFFKILYCFLFIQKPAELALEKLS